MTAGDRIRELRGNKTIQECANAVNITRSAWVKYERGERTPRDDIKIRIARYFGKSVQFIFYPKVHTS